MFISVYILCLVYICDEHRISFVISRYFNVLEYLFVISFCNKGNSSKFYPTTKGYFGEKKSHLSYNLVHLGLHSHVIYGVYSAPFF